jgi:hypothetical protein
MHEATKPNTKLVEAIRDAEQSRKDGFARIAEAMNEATRKRIADLNNLRTKLMALQVKNGMYVGKFTDDEVMTLWLLCGTRNEEYRSGTAHVCEYDTDFTCNVCGESL